MGKAESTVEDKAAVVNMDTLPDHVQSNIPNISLSSNFEAELQEIDAAIIGDVSGMHADTCMERIVRREENMLTQKDARLDRKE